jgi:hypothetical protein
LNGKKEVNAGNTLNGHAKQRGNSKPVNYQTKPWAAEKGAPPAPANVIWQVNIPFG